MTVIRTVALEPTVDAWLEQFKTAAKPGRRQTTKTGRMRKVLCGGCGCIVYASRGALQKSGLPICGCGERMQLAHLRDRAVVEWDELAAELESYGMDAWNDAMRELGYTDMVRSRGGRERRGGLVQKRCEKHGCHKFSIRRYCPEHEHDKPELTSASIRIA